MIQSVLCCFKLRKGPGIPSPLGLGTRQERKQRHGLLLGPAGAKTSRTEGEQVFAKEKGWIELGRLQAKVSSIAECNMYQHFNRIPDTLSPYMA
jgi:hypothetical protein